MINTGIFPGILIIAQVIFIYKKDDELTYYRPFSRLPMTRQLPLTWICRCGHTTADVDLGYLAVVTLQLTLT